MPRATGNLMDCEQSMDLRLPEFGPYDGRLGRTAGPRGTGSDERLVHSPQQTAIRIQASESQQPAYP